MAPYRLSLKMIDEQRWMMRNQIIWQKPNCMPSSAKDRFTNDYEVVFFFVKNKKYYFKQILEPYTEPMNRWGGQKLIANKESTWDKGTGQNSYRNRNMRPNPKGRNKRAIWQINTKPFKGSHFAVFPEKLIEPMIEAGCPDGGVVLDPFMGSGTTGLVAKKMGRNYIGIELNPNYVKMAEDRINSILI